MPDTIEQTIEQPRTSFSPLKQAGDEASEMGKLFSINPLPPEPPATKNIAPATKPDPTPPPPPKPVEPTEADDEKFLSTAEMPRQQKDWEARRQAESRRLSRKDAKIAELLKANEEAKKAQPIVNLEQDPRWQAKETEAKELSERLRLHDIQNHPKFKAFYDNKVNTQIDMAKRIVGKDNEEKVTAILNLPDGIYRDQQIEELMTGLSPSQSSRFGGVLNALDEINADKKNQVEAAKADFDRMQTESKAKAEMTLKQRQTEANALFDNTLKTFSGTDANALFVFQKKEGDEEWNKGVDTRVGHAKALLFNDQKPEDLIKAAFSAAALPAVINGYQSALKEIESLKEQVKGMTAAQPNIKGNDNGAETKDKKEVNPLKRGLIRNNLADAAEEAKALADLMTT